MFGKKKQPPIRTLIGEGTVVRGEMHFGDGLRIDGEIFGDVVAPGDRPEHPRDQRKSPRHRQGQGGPCDHQRRWSTGPVESAELLELQPKAPIIGDVSYEVLEMHQGATIDGELKPLKARGKTLT